jgi:uncharacterized protein YbjT (DUF2867 family)
MSSRCCARPATRYGSSAGTEIVLHLAGGPKGDDEATRTLVRAAARAGVRHFIYISVIGADRVPLAWLRSKLDAERAVADSGIPWTTLRAGAGGAAVPECRVSGVRWSGPLLRRDR